MTDIDIDSLIKELKRCQLHKWKDDTFEDLSIPWKEKKEDIFQTNLDVRLDQLRTEGKEQTHQLKTILRKIKMSLTNPTEKSSRQANTSQQKTTTATHTERGLPPETIKKSSKDLRVDGTTKKAANRPPHNRPGAENRKDENRLMEDIRQHLQKITELIGKPNTKGSNASGKNAKADMTSQEVADLTNVCSWITEKKSLMEETDKEIRKMVELIAKPDTTATKQPAKKKEATKEKENTESSKDLASESAAVIVWIEEQKTRWHAAEQEIQQMKQFVETNTPQTTQKSEKKKSSKNQTNDNKTSSDEFVIELSNVRTWFTETFEQSKSSMEQIGKQIMELKQSVEEPDSNETNTYKKKNATAKEASQGKTASPEELISCLKQVQSWIPKGKAEKDKDNWSAVTGWLEHIQQSIETPRQTPFSFNQTSLPCAKLMEETEYNLMSKIQKLEQQYSELTSDVQLCLKKLNDSSNVGDTKGRKKENPNQQEYKAPDAKELKVCIDNYKKDYKRLQQQYTELNSDVDECCEMLTNSLDVADADDRKKGSTNQQENKDPDTKKLKAHIDDFKKEYQRLEESEKALQLKNEELSADIKAQKQHLEKVEERLEESHKALESNNKKTMEENQLLKEKADSKSAEVDDIQRQYEVFSKAFARIQSICKSGTDERLKGKKNQNAVDTKSGAKTVKNRNLEKIASDTFELVTETITQFNKKLDEANTETDNYADALKIVCSICHNHRQADNATKYGKEKNKNQPVDENKGLLPERTIQLVTENTDRQNETKAENDNLRKEIEEVQKKFEAERIRLSKYMGADLRAGNPNITDLSDSNRPTKIAEAFSELYDNDWTNAFEELNKTKNATETNTIENLLDILRFAFDYCTEAAKKQLPDLEYYMRSPAVALSEKAKKESKKEKESVDPVTLQALHDFRKKTWTVASANLIKHYEKLMKSEKKWKDEYSSKECSLYITTCIQLCWQMVIQDPPVLIQFEKKAKKMKFDKDKYKAYKRSGEQVDFIVWPPIYLHERGPLLNKGVAEGK